MKRSKVWHGSSSQPDWTDVFILMKVLEELHGVLVSVHLGVGGFQGPSGFVTVAAMKVDADASLLGSPVAVLSGDWPCREHSDLVLCVYAGLHALDTELSKKLWQQNELPFTAE